jgi:hypothetical protein
MNKKQFIKLFKIVLLYKHLWIFLKQKRLWLKKGGKIDSSYMILSDYVTDAGSASGHYFHQDLLISQYIFQDSPKKHLDIGSRIDGFVAHVAAFREIEVMDIRPLKQTAHANIRFLQADLMRSQDLEKYDSISCLHAIEHFGLGRYGDEIDIDGHLKGIDNIIKILSANGILYISFPIGSSDKVYFNAHRVFHPKSILSYPTVEKELRLINFSFVDDKGDIQIESNIEDAVNLDLNYGCGIYSFRKI